MSIPSLILFYLLYPSFFIIVIFPGAIFALILLLLMIWFERKSAAFVQMRYGPLYASKRLGGALQLIADAIKYAISEIIIPNGVNPTLYALAPMLLITFAFIPIAVIPVSRIPISGSILSKYFLAFYDPDIKSGLYVGYFVPFNLLLALGLASSYSIFVLLTAWVTNNRFALIGAVREAFLSVSYDVLIVMSALALALEYHTLDIAKIVQSGIPGFIANPIAGVVFFIGVIMGTSRFPFEIVEADTEVVMGPYTEYTGLLYVITMGASYIATYSFALLYSDLFLGGWAPFSGLPGAVWMTFKAVLVLAFSVFLRSVYGRYRIDQAIRGSWKYVLPAALASIILGLVVGWLWIR